MIHPAGQSNNEAWGGVSIDGLETGTTPVSIGFSFTPTDAIHTDQSVTVTSSQSIWAAAGSAACVAWVRSSLAQVLAFADGALVGDNLSTIVLTAGTVGFPADTARRLTVRVRPPASPVHASLAHTQ